MSALLNIFYIPSLLCITIIKAIVIGFSMSYNLLADRERLCIGGFLWRKTPFGDFLNRHIARHYASRYAYFLAEILKNA